MLFFQSCSNGAYYPHKECSKFNICVNGVLLTQSCAPGEGWSAPLSICAPGVCKRRVQAYRPRVKKPAAILSK